MSNIWTLLLSTIVIVFVLFLEGAVLVSVFYVCVKEYFNQKEAFLKRLGNIEEGELQIQ